jgi:hypothetical protein
MLMQTSYRMDGRPVAAEVGRYAAAFSSGDKQDGQLSLPRTDPGRVRRERCAPPT